MLYADDNVNAYTYTLSENELTVQVTDGRPGATATISAYKKTPDGIEIKDCILDASGNGMVSFDPDTVTETPESLLIKLEAEKATRSDTSKLTIKTSHSGYFGTGYVSGFNNSDGNATLTFAVNVDEAGPRDLTIRYATEAKQGAANMSLNVNGASLGTITLPYTGASSRWADRKMLINLEAGENTIVIRTDSNGSTTCIDNIVIEKSPRTLEDYAVTIIPAANGSITASANVVDGVAKRGDNITFTITPDPGYFVNKTIINGEPVELTDNSYTLIYVQADVTATATFLSEDFSPTKYEAEDAQYSSPLFFAKNDPGFSGSGFIGGFSENGNPTLTFNNVNVDSSGTYELTLGYVAGRGNPVTNTALYVNGSKVQDINVPGTASWSTWASAKMLIDLKAGENIVAIRSESASPNSLNADYIEIKLVSCQS